MMMMMMKMIMIVVVVAVVTLMMVVMVVMAGNIMTCPLFVSALLTVSCTLALKIGGGCRRYCG